MSELTFELQKGEGTAFLTIQIRHLP